MTGFGRAEGVFNNKKYSVELRSLNNRYLEIQIKSPKYLIAKDFEIKDIIREKISRGKIYVIISLDNEIEQEFLSLLTPDALKSYLQVLKNIRKNIGSSEKIKIDHILKLAESVSSEMIPGVDDTEFSFIKSLLHESLGDLLIMKQNEGKFLEKDILKRIDLIESAYSGFEEFAKVKIQKERDKIKTLVNEIVSDQNNINENRIELEIALLAEKLDITEECTRLQSHIKYFRNFISSDEFSGRRLNFILQEMNREVNTVASKSNDAVISQTSAVIKEELEKIREQVQNIE
ncbi:MAG: YicC family protein [Ignavibacteria bacterium]|nr:YicC family protein [Ignavibacteria bacterium]